MTEINLDLARKVLEIVDQGLTQGLGVQEPGKMCVEAAVCSALGLPHGDNPPCVWRDARGFKIGLNDENWTSDAARAAGMRALAVAQLGSHGTAGIEYFAEELFSGFVRVFMPTVLDEVGPGLPGSLMYRSMSGVMRGLFDWRSGASFARSAYRMLRQLNFDSNFAYRSKAFYLRAAMEALGDADAGGNLRAACNVTLSFGHSARSLHLADQDDDRLLVLAADLAFDALEKCGSPGVELYRAIQAELPCSPAV